MVTWQHVTCYLVNYVSGIFGAIRFLIQRTRQKRRMSTFFLHPSIYHNLIYVLFFAYISGFLRWFIIQLQWSGVEYSLLVHQCSRSTRILPRFASLAIMLIHAWFQLKHARWFESQHLTMKDSNDAKPGRVLYFVMCV